MLETHADFCSACGEGVLSDKEAVSEAFRHKGNEELWFRMPWRFSRARENVPREFQVR